MTSSPESILISAGEASGDTYAAWLATELGKRWPGTRFFGCAGPRMRNAGVRPTIRTEDLAVVGIIEVLDHLPHIFRKMQELVAAAQREKPAVAILTDSPDFHLRVAKKLKKLGIPVIYLVAPQAWAWRKGRVHTMRRVIERLLCIFPFEEAFFRENRVPVTYIGHPLASRIRPRLTREEFFKKHRIADDRPLITILPGSRKGESLRHIPDLKRAVEILSQDRKLSFILPASPVCGDAFFLLPLAGSPIRVIDGEAWEALAYCDLALAASGTVTVEAALLGAPLVTFYKVTPASWKIGQWLVNVPFYSMVNLIAERRIVPELMQDDMTGENLATEAARLLDDEAGRAKMKEELARVASRLTGEGDAIVRAADEVVALMRSRLPGETEAEKVKPE